MKNCKECKYYEPCGQGIIRIEQINCLKDLEEHDKEVRVDAIDDVFKLISTLLNKDCPSGCYCVDNTELCPYIECIHDIANGLNELKEQTNV